MAKCILVGNRNDWERWFTKLRCFWIHDGNFKRPHALLTSGLHSDGYFNASIIIEYPFLLEAVCESFVSIFKNGVKRGSSSMVDYVYGSALGACTFSYEIARQLKVKCGFTEPKDGKMILKRFSFKPEARILVVEDVITTGRTTIQTIRCLEKVGAIVSKEIFAIDNRSGKDYLEGRTVLSLIDLPMSTWKAEKCPLCKKGSMAIRPKENWDRLTAKY